MLTLSSTAAVTVLLDGQAHRSLNSPRITLPSTPPSMGTRRRSKEVRG